MRPLILIALLMAFLNSVSGQVVRGEYFIDTDPGYGRGNGIEVIAGDDIGKSFTAVLSSVSPGFHIVYLRMIDAQRRWSQTIPHPFYVGLVKANGVIGSEYFIDVDPGIGKATKVEGSVGSDSTLKLVLPLSSLTTGFHKLGLRSVDNNSAWSQTTSHAFYVNESNELVNITSLQYYFKGAGATDEVYTYQVLQPSPLINLNFKADLSKLVGDREYDMHIWALNEKGVRSEVMIKKIKACNNDPIKAGFDFIPLGTRVSFIDSSRGKGKYQWIFGDGKTDSVSSPVHAYTAGGNYLIKQIVSNFCNSDTATKMVSALILKSIYPSVGGNKGTVTVSVTGAGLNANSVVRLLPASGGSEIKPDSILVNNTGSILTGTLNLNGKQPGVYNVVVNTNNVYDTLKLAFVIQEGQLPDVFVEIIGRDVIRGNGVEQKYSIHFGNKGNNDVYAVPLWIAGLPKNARWRLFAAIDTLNKNNRPVPVEIIHEDSSKAIPLIISRLPAKSDFTLEFGIAVPAIGDTLRLVSWLSQPLFTAATTIKEESTYESVRSLLAYAIEESIGKEVKPACLDKSVDVFYSFLKDIATPKKSFSSSSDYFLSYIELLTETMKTVSGCEGNILEESHEIFYRSFLWPLLNIEKGVKR